MKEPERKRRIVWGARAIGEVIGVDAQKAYYLLQRGRIPGRKVGDEWTAEESELLDFFRNGTKAVEAA
jgi:hypothetical protein